MLIRAVAAVPDAWLVTAGDGPEAAPLRALATRLGMTGRVRFLGECGGVGTAPGIPAVLSAVDLFVSASREESFGLAVVEALAAGLPVVHGVCPAVEDLPAGRVPGTTRVGAASGATDPTAELTAALRHHVEGGARRLPPPAAVDHYDIRLSSRRLMDVYAQSVGTATVPPTERAHP